MRARFISLCLFLLSAAPALAQEPMTVLDQPHWRVGAVCVGLNQCGFCNATDAAEDGVTLRVEPPKDISLGLPEGWTVSTAMLTIGGERFTLTNPDGQGFAATAADGSRIIRAMRQETSLTLQLGQGDASRSDHYGLEAFPKAYAAMLKACPSAAGP
jgi:hypothetical protein